ncbi:MAG TPA: tetratricopeptide repeat protein [Chthonomonadaceae bacterium]|nr:tetratricopeptide repeat protein [Chthonomonadaceae bacterium]
MATDPATAAEAARSTPEETVAASAVVRQSADAAPSAGSPEAPASAGNERASSDTGRLAPAETLGGAAAGSSEKDAVRTLLSQANLYRLRGLWAGAVDRCIAVLKIQPENPTAHSLLGDIYRDQNKIDDAIQWYRMAIQLRPNPSDEAKLKQMERERAREQRAAEARARAETARAKATTVSAGGTAATGTAALLGISPRRWLRGMTLVSAAFILVVIIALIALQMNRSHAPEHTAPMDTFPTAQQAQPLPPAQHPNLAAANMSTDTNESSDGSSPAKVVSGSGMPPDHPDSAAATTTTSSTGKTHTTSNKQKSKNAESVSTATVLSVQSAPQEPGAVFYENAILPADASAIQVKLPGGMQIAEVHLGPGSAFTMTINAPNSFRKRLDEDSVRAQMIRTLYRASRSVFSVLKNTNAGFISFKTPGDTNEILHAEIDRNAALTNNPDSETALALQQRLIAVKFYNNP